MQVSWFGIVDACRFDPVLAPQCSKISMLRRLQPGYPNVHLPQPCAPERTERYRPSSNIEGYQSIGSYVRRGPTIFVIPGLAARENPEPRGGRTGSTLTPHRAAPTFVRWLLDSGFACSAPE